ncbi:hypothetical protein V8J88_03935 [Massilia sp. W12]|uniref:hypothetical protein n=1 Tax=Massilia sp. W12 TaxID=3126507 RepID=UPI0030D0BF0C
MMMSKWHDRIATALILSGLMIFSYVGLHQLKLVDQSSGEYFAFSGFFAIVIAVWAYGLKRDLILRRHMLFLAIVDLLCQCLIGFAYLLNAKNVIPELYRFIYSARIIPLSAIFFATAYVSATCIGHLIFGFLRESLAALGILSISYLLLINRSEIMLKTMWVMFAVFVGFLLLFISKKIRDNEEFLRNIEEFKGLGGEEQVALLRFISSLKATK